MIQKVPISSIKPNESNPRIIRDEKFNKLVNSIKSFPQMLELRPIVVNERNVILGGNMRHKACIEAGLKEVYIVRSIGLTPEQEREFIIKDNVGFGEWDWDILANEWDVELLGDWGLDLWKQDDINIEDFFEEAEQENNITKNKIVLEYTDKEHQMVLDAFEKHEGSKEQVVFKLLGL